jgi:hypothetical protein
LNLIVVPGLTLISEPIVIVFVNVAVLTSVSVNVNVLSLSVVPLGKVYSYLTVTEFLAFESRLLSGSTTVIVRVSPAFTTVLSVVIEASVATNVAVAVIFLLVAGSTYNALIHPLINAGSFMSILSSLSFLLPVNIPVFGPVSVKVMLLEGAIVPL